MFWSDPLTEVSCFALPQQQSPLGEQPRGGFWAAKTLRSRTISQGDSLLRHLFLGPRARIARGVRGVGFPPPPRGPDELGWAPFDGQATRTLRGRTKTLPLSTRRNCADSTEFPRCGWTKSISHQFAGWFIPVGFHAAVTGETSAALLRPCDVGVCERPPPSEGFLPNEPFTLLSVEVKRPTKEQSQPQLRAAIRSSNSLHGFR